MSKKYIKQTLMTAALFSALSPVYAADKISTQELEGITVVGSAGKLEGLKFKSAQSNAVIRKDEIMEQAPAKMEDALKYQAGVQTGMYGYDTKKSWFKVRGFDASLAVDGAPVTQHGFYSIIPNSYGLEAIEVVKGADSLTYGSAETGGLVNLVSKRPTKNAKNEVGVQLGNHGLYGIFGDYNGKITADNRLRYRIVGNYDHRNGNTKKDWRFVGSFKRDDTNGDTHNYYIAPSLAWDITPKTNVTILSSFSRQSGTPTSVHLPANGVLFPSTVSGKTVSFGTHYGEPNVDYVKRNQASLGYELKHDFGNGLKFSQNYRYNQLDLDWLGTFAWGSDGDSTAYRGYSYTDGKMKTHTIDNRLSKEWKGNGWRNTLLGGVDYLHAKTNGINNGFGGVNTSDLFNPVYGQGGIVKSGTVYDVKQKQLGVYLRNQFTYNGLVANVGVRRDKAESDSISGTSTSAYDTKHTSYQGSLIYNLKNGVSPYVSYSESFKPQAGVDSYGKAYKPYEGRQYEVGVKYLPSFIDGKFSAAFFDLREKNALVADASAVQRQIGERNSKGFELQADANFANNVTGTFAYTYTNAKQDLSYNKTIRAALIPQHQASAQMKYHFNQGALNGLTVGGGLRYVGSTVDEQYWSGYKVPSYTLVDFMAQYNFANNWQAQLNVNNLTNKKYIGGCDFYCYWGAKRSVTAQVKYQF